MRIYSKYAPLPEEIEKKKQKKQKAEFWLIKVPLILWVLVTLAIFGISDNGTFAWFLLVFGYLGLFVLPWIGICKLMLRDSFK